MSNIHYKYINNIQKEYYTSIQNNLPIFQNSSPITLTPTHCQILDQQHPYEILSYYYSDQNIFQWNWISYTNQKKSYIKSIFSTIFQTDYNLSSNELIEINRLLLKSHHKINTILNIELLLIIAFNKLKQKCKCILPILNYKNRHYIISNYTEINPKIQKILKANNYYLTYIALYNE